MEFGKSVEKGWLSAESVSTVAWFLGVLGVLAFERSANVLPLAVVTGVVVSVIVYIVWAMIMEPEKLFML